jgi:hypothetical protein
MAYINCRGCGLCLKCIVTNYCKHIYVYDWVEYMCMACWSWGTGFLGDDYCSSVCFWYFFGGGYLLILLGYGLGLVTSSWFFCWESVEWSCSSGRPSVPVYLSLLAGVNDLPQPYCTWSHSMIMYTLGRTPVDQGSVHRKTSLYNTQHS